MLIFGGVSRKPQSMSARTRIPVKSRKTSKPGLSIYTHPISCYRMTSHQFLGSRSVLPWNLHLANLSSLTRKLSGNQSMPFVLPLSIIWTSACAAFKHKTIPCPLNPACTQSLFSILFSSVRTVGSCSCPTNGLPSAVAPMMPVHSHSTLSSSSPPVSPQLAAP
jgi:hypothetical protein